MPSALSSSNRLSSIPLRLDYSLVLACVKPAGAVGPVFDIRKVANQNKPLWISFGHNYSQVVTTAPQVERRAKFNHAPARSRNTNEARSDSTT